MIDKEIEKYLQSDDIEIANLGLTLFCNRYSEDSWDNILSTWFDTDMNRIYKKNGDIWIWRHFDGTVQLFRLEANYGNYGKTGFGAVDLWAMKQKKDMPLYNMINDTKKDNTTTIQQGPGDGQFRFSLATEKCEGSSDNLPSGGSL